MSDLIDRNLIGELVDSHGNVHYEDIMKIPSAQDAPDTVSRQKVLDLIRQSAISEDGTSSLLYQSVKNLPSAEPNTSESPNGWIPVSERLPEKDGDYLVTYEKGYAEDYGFDLIGIAPFEVGEGFGIWQERFDHVSLGCLGCEWVDIPVVVWMPLPEPYQAEEESCVN